MFKFILGVVVTLAILYPASTKTIFSNLVDSTHTVAIETLKEAQK